MYKTILHYQIRLPLGQNNLSFTCRGKNTKTKEDVLIKSYQQSTFQQGSPIYQRFIFEINFHKIPYVISNNQYIIQPIQLITSNNNYYVVTKNCEEWMLDNRIKEQGMLSQKEAIHILAQIVSGYTIYRNLNMPPRDMTEFNILLTEERTVKIDDLGFLKYTDSIDLQNRIYTINNAPQIYDNIYDPDQTDSWSIGILYYYMIFGEMPFDTQKFQELDENQYIKKSNQVLQRIQKLPIILPLHLHNINNASQDLLIRLLHTDYKKRLGWMEILHHPAFMISFQRETRIQQEIAQKPENWKGYAQLVFGDEIDTINDYEKKQNLTSNNPNITKIENHNYGTNNLNNNTNTNPNTSKNYIPIPNSNPISDQTGEYNIKDELLKIINQNNQILNNENFNNKSDLSSKLQYPSNKEIQYPNPTNSQNDDKKNYPSLYDLPKFQDYGDSNENSQEQIDPSQNNQMISSSIQPSKEIQKTNINVEENKNQFLNQKQVNEKIFKETQTMGQSQIITPVKQEISENQFEIPINNMGVTKVESNYKLEEISNQKFYNQINRNSFSLEKQPSSGKSRNYSISIENDLHDPMVKLKKRIENMINFYNLWGEALITCENTLNANSLSNMWIVACVFLFKKLFLVRNLIEHRLQNGENILQAQGWDKFIISPSFNSMKRRFQTKNNYILNSLNLLIKDAVKQITSMFKQQQAGLIYEHVQTPDYTDGFDEIFFVYLNSHKSIIEKIIQSETNDGRKLELKKHLIQIIDSLILSQIDIGLEVSQFYDPKAHHNIIKTTLEDRLDKYIKEQEEVLQIFQVIFRGQGYNIP